MDLGEDMLASERDSLLFFLKRLRDSVIRTSAGPAEEELRTPGVPSGTDLLGLIRHLTAMEVKWFQDVFLGVAIEETARHAGHADILRELVDGETDL